MDARKVLRRADALHEDRDYEQAAEAYRQALAADASLIEAWYGLGCACISLENYGEAAPALRQAVSLRADLDGARFKLAEALFQLGEVDAAVAEFARLAHSGDQTIRVIAKRNLAIAAPGAASCDHSAVLAARRDWIDLAAREERANRLGVSQKLKIGYLRA
jgi:tetratricopeptide (TPR) repeat protein